MIEPGMIGEKAIVVQESDTARLGGCLLYTSPSPETPEHLVCRLLLEKKNNNR